MRKWPFAPAWATVGVDVWPDRGVCVGRFSDVLLDSYFSQVQRLVSAAAPLPLPA